MRETGAQFARRIVAEWRARVTDDCIPWPLAKLRGGYGQLTVTENGRPMGTTAHRYVCRLAYGEPPSPSHHAAHRPDCNNRQCVNPAHLYWATPKENAADRTIVGSDWRGERYPYRKLSEAEVRAIRAMADARVKHRVIADVFGITRGHVSQIVGHRRWAYSETEAS